MTIAIGDYNATISSSTQSRAAGRGVIGPVSPDNTNDNGDRLLKMCATDGLAITNTWFQRKRIHQFTWLSNDGRTKKMIDIIMINRRWFSSVRNCRTYRGVELGNADPRLVAADIRLKLRVTQKAQTTKPMNGRLFMDHALQARYTIEISNRFSALSFGNDPSLPDMWEQFREEVTNAAIKSTKSNKYPRKPWVSQESLIMIAEWRNARLAGNMPLYRTLPRRRNVALQRDQNKYWNDKAETLENAANNNDHAIMFREFRTLATSTTVKNNINIVKDKEGNIISNNCDCLNRWKEHYSELLKNTPSRTTQKHLLRQRMPPLICPYPKMRSHSKKCERRKVSEKRQSGRNMQYNGRTFKVWRRVHATVATSNNKLCLDKWEDP